jgi:hypothetical protein
MRSRGAPVLPWPAQAALLQALDVGPGRMPAARFVPGAPTATTAAAGNRKADPPSASYQTQDWRVLREAALAAAEAPGPRRAARRAWAVRVYGAALWHARQAQDWDALTCCLTPLADTLLPPTPRTAAVATRTSLPISAPATVGGTAGDAETEAAALAESVRVGRLLLAVAQGAAAEAVARACAWLQGNGVPGWVWAALGALSDGNMAVLARLAHAPSLSPDARAWVWAAMARRRPGWLAAAAVAWVDLPLPLLCAWAALPDPHTAAAHLAQAAPRAVVDHAQDIVLFRPPRSPAVPSS